MIGDSWENDILGALGVGMTPVWLNRYRCDCPAPALAVEIGSLETAEDILRVLGVREDRA